MKKMLMFGMLLTSTMLGACNLTVAPQQKVSLDPVVDPIQVAPTTLLSALNEVRSLGYTCPNGTTFPAVPPVAEMSELTQEASQWSAQLAQASAGATDAYHIAMKAKSEDAKLVLHNLLQDDSTCNALLSPNIEGIGIGQQWDDSGIVHWGIIYKPSLDLVVIDPLPIDPVVPILPPYTLPSDEVLAIISPLRDVLNTVRNAGYSCADGQALAAAASLTLDLALIPIAQRAADAWAEGKIMADDTADGLSLHLTSSQKDAVSAVKNWLQDPNTCATLLSSKWQGLGVGHSTDASGVHHWVVTLSTELQVPEPIKVICWFLPPEVTEVPTPVPAPEEIPAPIVVQ